MHNGWMNEAFNMLVNQPQGGFGAKNMNAADVFSKIKQMDKEHQIMSAACL